MPPFYRGVSETTSTTGLSSAFQLGGGLIAARSTFTERLEDGVEVTYFVTDGSKTEWRRGVFDRGTNSVDRGVFLNSTTGNMINWGVGRKIIEIESGLGEGNILGPDLSTVVEIPVFSDTSGTELLDGLGIQIAHSDTQTGPITTFGSPLAVYADKSNGITAAYVNQAIYSTVPSDWGVFYDVVRSVLVATPNTTTPVQNGYGSWIINSTERDIEVSAFPNTSNFWGGSVANADFAAVWGMTLILTDHLGQVETENPEPRYLFGQEISFNFMSSNSGGNALQFTGQSLAWVDGVNAIALYHLDGFGGAGTGNRSKWASMLYSDPGSTNYFALIGGVNRPGQIVGNIIGTVLTVESITSGVVSLGASLSTPSGGFISEYLTGTLGGVGTYTVSPSQTFTSGTIYLGANSQAVIFSGYEIIAAVPISATIQLDVFGQFQFIAPPTGSINMEVGSVTEVITSSAGLSVSSSAAYATAGGPFAISDITTLSKQLYAGFDTAIDAAFIQSIHSGTGLKPLLLNPNAGAGSYVGINNLAPAVTLDVGATASEFRVRNLFTGSAGEWFGISWAGNVASIGPGADGTGTIRSTSAVGEWVFSDLNMQASSPAFQINNSAQTPTTGGLVRILGSGSSYYWQINTAAGADFSTVVNAFAISSAGDVFFPGNTSTVSINTSATDFLHKTTGTLANGAGAGAGTITNAPAAGNPTKWIPISDNGTTRYIPAW